MVQQGSASILINHIKTWDSSQLSWPLDYLPKLMIDQKIDSESDGCGVEVDEVKENRPEEKVRKVLKLRRNIDQPKPDSQRIGDDKSSDDDDKIAIHKIGFEGPMIDFKSPTASDDDPLFQNNSQNKQRPLEIQLAIGFFYWKNPDDIWNQLVMWPSEDEHKESSQVMQLEGFPKCIGFVDETTIPLKSKTCPKWECILGEQLAKTIRELEIEDLMESESDSDREEDILLLHDLYTKRYLVPQSSNKLSKTYSPEDLMQLSPSNFKQLNRTTHIAFGKLCDLLRGDSIFYNNSRHKQIALEIQVASSQVISTIQMWERYSLL
ncbi:hypothetical protein PPACK8108_LOCUS24396 [Phakopsora pachyrhizi]|uniref:Uncharacterized protein n=1 Tax=Phakopsora pachyrhizi TaxID=170000 RepID=A0AAV0BRW6_PHAPC|nr:hypothetical protein PPACK8108_LOCUS24396 [Phakopsora pachyrhizi]